MPENVHTSGVFVQLLEAEVNLLDYDYLDREFACLTNCIMLHFERQEEQIAEGIPVLKVLLHKSQLA